VQTVPLPNDGVLPTASIFTESFEEIFLPNDIFLPNSAHKSVPFLYQFLVLTLDCYPLFSNECFSTVQWSGLFAWLISHQPAVLFSHNKPATSNQPAVLFSQNKPAPAISHQPTEQAGDRGVSLSPKLK
jgi:hypothetical protein